MRSAIEKEALLRLSLLLFSRSAVGILLLLLHFIKLLSLMDSFSSGRHEFLATDLRSRIAGGKHFSQSKKVNLAPGNRISSCFG